MSNGSNGELAHTSFMDDIKWKMLGQFLENRAESSEIEELDKYISKLSDKEVGLIKKYLAHDSVSLGKLKSSMVGMIVTNVNNMLYHLYLPGTIIIPEC